MYGEIVVRKRHHITNLCKKCGLAETCIAPKNEPQTECPRFREMARRRAASTIPKGEKCQLCGSTMGLLRHHHDYAHPYSVIIVCGKCHRWLHAHTAFQPGIGASTWK